LHSIARAVDGFGWFVSKLLESTMEKLQRILIVGGHPLLIAGLRFLLAEEPDLEVLAGTRGPGEVRTGVAELRPQLLLVDRSLRGAYDFETLAAVRRRFPDARVLMIVRQRSDEIIQESLRAGANGCVRNDASYAEIRATIRSVLQGYDCLEVEVPVNSASAQANGRPSRQGGEFSALTPRERDVLKLVAAGKSSKTIAEMLALSVKTVGKHRANLMAKLDLHNASGLTAYAMARGLHLKPCNTPPD
jgi:DNA-binding NarL/FixJ family response regulator